MNNKLTATTAQAILSRIAAGARQQDLATEFHVSPAAISNLVAGKSWPALIRVNKAPKAKHGTKLTPTDVQVVLQRLAQGETPTAIALDYGVSRQAIANIQKGRAWTDVPRPIPVRPQRRKVWEI